MPGAALCGCRLRAWTWVGGIRRGNKDLKESSSASMVQRRSLERKRSNFSANRLDWNEKTCVLPLERTNEMWFRSFKMMMIFTVMYVRTKGILPSSWDRTSVFKVKCSMIRNDLMWMIASFIHHRSVISTLFSNFLTCLNITLQYSKVLI